ncbi:MAG: hypothetical protein WBC07_08585 [Methylotenera sp.]
MKIIILITVLLTGCAGMTIPDDFDAQNKRNDGVLQDMQRNDRPDMYI